MSAQAQAQPPFDQEKMQQLLQEMQQVSLPVVVDNWPLAIGYWLLLGLLVLAGIFFGCLYYKNRYRRYLANKLQRAFASDISAIDYIALANATIKQIAIKLSSRQKVAKLTKKSWLEYIANRCVEPMPKSFKHGIEISLYSGEFDKNLLEFHNYTLLWIKTHKTHK